MVVKWNDGLCGVGERYEGKTKNAIKIKMGMRTRGIG
jgi:hypothetical protein